MLTLDPDLVIRMVHGELPSDVDLINVLHDICITEVAEGCNSDCPVFKKMKETLDGTRRVSACPCYSSGLKMLDFLRRN